MTAEQFLAGHRNYLGRLCSLMEHVARCGRVAIDPRATASEQQTAAVILACCVYGYFIRA